MRGVVCLGIASVLAATAVSRPAAALVWPDVPEKVERDLASTDPAVRRAAAETLDSLGLERARPLVIRALGDADEAVRLAAAEAAERVRIPEATTLVLPWLGEHNARLRLAACEVARVLPDERAVAPLARALSDIDAGVRALAAEALGNQRGKLAVAPLLGKLDDSSPSVRVEIARALGRLGDKRAVVPLIGKVEDSVPDVRQAVALALGEIGDLRASPALVLQLRDSLAEVRTTAVAALGRLGAGDAVDAMAPLASERSAEVRQVAMGALGQIASPGAISVLIARLGQDDDGGGGLERTAVRDALALAGAAAIPRLRTVLSGAQSASATASAAWVLGELRDKASAPDIVRSLRRGALATAAALHALKGAGQPESIELVLEFVDDENPAVRTEAFDAASALLDPARPDGRAVEPLLAAAESPRLRPADRIRVIGLLARTGAARAAPIIRGFVASKDSAIKLAAIDALGALGPTHTDEVLIPLLRDATNAELRLRAAVALSTSGSAVARDAISASLGEAKEVDRRAALVALGGILTREPSEPVFRRLRASLDLAAGGERDAILLVLGRAAPVHPMLEKLVALSDTDDRRTLAAALAGRTDARDLLALLLTDHDPSVQADAAWSLGTVGVAVAPLLPLVASPEADLAIDAAAAVGRIAARTSKEASVAALCPLLEAGRPLVRANALVGLSLAHVRCGDGARERALVVDPTDEVRAAAARALGATATASPEDVEALRACAAADRSGEVALACRDHLAHTTASATGKTHAVEVYVEAGPTSEPTPLAPYVVQLADGTIRVGTSDRRGAFFDPVAPDGTLELRRTTYEGRRWSDAFSGGSGASRK